MPVAVLCLVLAAITFAVFGQTLHDEFVNCDDETYVYENPVVAGGLTTKGILWAFSFHANNWHPLTWLSHELDCQLYGLGAAGHHLTNVLFHTATVIALFLLLRQMTDALWRSAFVAAVFAIHPLRVESVAWVAERKDVLSGLFFMLTIGAYARYAGHLKSKESNSKFYYALTLVFFFLGLMSKPMLVTVPLVLLWMDYWPLQRTESTLKLVMEKLPLLALSAAGCVLTLRAQSGAIQSNETVSLPLRLGNALVTCVIYLGQMFWPAGLALFYPYPRDGQPAWEIALAGTLLAGLSVVAWRFRRTQPWMLVGWVWYLVMLLPVVGIIQVGAQAHADRYTYLPQIGIYVALIWLASEWRAGRAALGGLMTVALAVLMVCAWRQASYWKDSETLWTRSLACTTSNSIAHLNLGNALLQKGKVDNAITQYQRALEINSGYADAHFNLGIALSQKGRTDDAISQYQQALQIKPGYAEAHVNLGIALLQKGRADEAISHYREALQINQDYTEARVNLGNALAQKGKMDDAIHQYQAALQIKPQDEVAQVNLGIILLQTGRAGEAISHFQTALQLAPSDVKAKSNLAWLLATCSDASLRDGRKAVELAQQANTLTGGEKPMILHSLAAALAEAGQFAEALAAAQRALNLAEAQSNTRLAGQLQIEIGFYQAGRPYHTTEATH